jgi:hypothetical protein
MNLIMSHPVISALAAYFILSALVDAFAKVPPVPGDSRVYVFTYTFLNGFVGNVATAIKAFLVKKTT